MGKFSWLPVMTGSAPPICIIATITAKIAQNKAEACVFKADSIF
jgi:hypothetical protein